MGLPFDSGQYLALRVFPENGFSPYKTVWHRDPEGQWSIFVDGPRFDTACPRYYGPACTHIGHATIELPGPDRGRCASTSTSHASTGSSKRQNRRCSARSTP